MGTGVEFHFQEGFTGQLVILAVDGKVHLSSELKTRLQIGLALIETLELASGQTITIEVPDLQLQQSHEVVPSDQWISVNLVEHALVVQQEERSPGYV